MRYKLLFVGLVLGMYMSCGDAEEVVETTCFTFDIRACHTDPWFEGNPVQDIEVQKNLIEAYFSQEGIEIRDIVIDEDFHDIVCMACHVCPVGSRVYIRMAAADTTKLAEIDLLNAGDASCGDIF